MGRVAFADGPRSRVGRTLECGARSQFAGIPRARVPRRLPNRSHHALARSVLRSRLALNRPR